VGLPRGHRRLVLTHERAVRREPLLPPRGQPLDRDAAGADRHGHRRSLRVPSAAARGLPRGPELLGARRAVAHRVGLSAIPRLARAVSGTDAQGILPPQLLGGGRGQRARDRGDGRADRRRSHVHLHRLPALRLELPLCLDEPPEERAQGDGGADPRGRRASLRLHRGPFQEGGRGRVTPALTTSPAWVGSELAGSTDWIRPVSAAAIAEGDAALAGLARRGLACAAPAPPDLHALLYADYWRSRQGEEAGGEREVYALPIFAEHAGKFTTQYSRTFVEAAQKLPDVPRLSAAQDEALDLHAAVCEELCFAMEFRPGDLQLLNNHVVYHARTAFEDTPGVDNDRLL